MPIRAIMFDLDGTLADTLDDLTDAYNHGLEQLKLPGHRPEDFKMMVGTGSLDLCRKALPPDRADLAEKLLQISLAYYSEHYLDKTRPYPGITELLDELTRRGIRLAVLSNKPDSFVTRMSKEMFGPDRFDLIAGQQDGVPLKPDPAAVLSILQQLKLPPAEAIYVGDSGIDMATASAANITSIGVTWGFRDRKDLLDAGANHIIDRAQDLLDLL